MIGKRGMDNFSLVVVIVVVLAVIVGSMSYYSTSISGFGTRVVPARCMPNPKLEGLNDATIKLKTELANFADVATRCDKYSTSVSCEDWRIAGSSESICLWYRGCGDGVVDSYFGEQCEGTDNFGGKTCATYGFSGGKLNCRFDCRIDLKSCTD